MRRRPSLVLALAVLLPGCRPDPALAEPTDAGRREDAWSLPPFSSDADERAEEIERYHVALGDAPVRGPADAAVTIVMFSDFECPFCERGHRTLQELARTYPDDLRIAYKAFPLDSHGHALIAAMVARTAMAEGKFWQFHDRLYSQRGLDLPTLMTYAQEVGLDRDRVLRDLDTLRHGLAVRDEMRQGRRLGVDSTPTFFVNGRAVSGAKPIEEFVALVEEELALARKWQGEGVAREDLYAHAIRDGFQEVVYTDRRGLDPDSVYEVPIGDSPVLGPADAPVTIVVFADFQCRYCARGSTTVAALRERYGDRLRIVHKHNPLSFHSHAFVASRAAVAAQRQGEFWAYHDALYALDGRIDEAALTDIAGRVGLDMKAFWAAMNDIELDREIQADLDLGMRLRVTGTPAYFVNGRPLEGAQPELLFRLLIEEELVRAAAASARGVAPQDLYETLTHEPLP